MPSIFSANNQVVYPVNFFSLHDQTRDFSNIEAFQALVKQKLNIEIDFKDMGPYIILCAKTKKDADRLKVFLKDHIKILVCLSIFDKAAFTSIKPLQTSPTNPELVLVDPQCALQAGIIFCSNEIARNTFVSSIRNYRKNILPWSKNLPKGIFLEVKPTLPPFYMFTNLDTFNLFGCNIIS